jgi:hypothetical protein
MLPQLHLLVYVSGVMFVKSDCLTFLRLDGFPCSQLQPCCPPLISSGCSRLYHSLLSIFSNHRRYDHKSDESSREIPDPTRPHQ